MNVRHPMGVLHSLSMKNIFYDKMDLWLFYFRVRDWFTCCRTREISHAHHLLSFKLTN